MGGYGFFDHRICKTLSKDSQIRLLIAGPDGDKAKGLAPSLGLPADQGLSLDATASPSEEGVLVSTLTFDKTEGAKAAAPVTLTAENAGKPVMLAVGETVVVRLRGHPVGFAATCGPDLMALTGDQGARSVLQVHAPYALAVDDAGCIHDVDTPEALDAARRLLAQSL